MRDALERVPLPDAQAAQVRAWALVAVAYDARTPAAGRAWRRGRVLALWIMGFGGTVGLGNLVAGKVIDATSVTAVLLANSAVAFFLAWYADVRVPEDAPPLVAAPAD